MHTEVVKGPIRPNSYEARVLSFVRRGDSKQTIQDETGIHGDTLTHAIKRARAKYTGKLTPEEQALIHRENTSFGRGGIWVAVREYFPLDLTARQTQAALYVDHGIEIEDHRRITNAYAREMHRHGLQRPITELTVEAQRDKRRSREELLNIVRNRQAAYRVMLTLGLEKPKTLQQWRELEQDPLTAEEISKLAELLLNPIFVPRDTLAQRYLLNLANGSPHLNEDIEIIDPTIKNKLALKASLILRQAKG